MTAFPRIARRIVAVAATAALGAAVAGGAVAAADRPATTGLPGTYAVVNVRVGDAQVTLSRTSSHGVNVVAFVIRNTGRKAHQFKIGDTKSAVLRPGQLQDLPINFDDFGKYRYSVTLNGTKSTHGVFSVNR